MKAWSTLATVALSWSYPSRFSLSVNPDILVFDDDCDILVFHCSLNLEEEVWPSYLATSF